MKQIWRAIKAADEDRLTCQECQDRIPEYLFARTTQDLARWQAVELHITMCPVCSAAYAELRELSAAADGQLGDEPAYWPHPSLAFLAPRSSEPSLSLLGAISRVVITLSHDINHALQMPPQAGLAPAGVRSGRSGIRQVVIEDVGDDLAVTVAIEQAADTPAVCVIRVEAQIPSRGGWPNLGGTEVTLRHDDQDLDTRETNPYGEVVFDDVASADLPNLAIIVKPSI